MFLSNDDVIRYCNEFELEFKFRFNITKNGKSYEMVFVRDTKLDTDEKLSNTHLVCLCVEGLPIVLTVEEPMTRIEANDSVFSHAEYVETYGGNFFKVLDNTLQKIEAKNKNKNKDIPMTCIAEFTNDKGKQVAVLYASLKNDKLKLRYEYTR